MGSIIRRRFSLVVLAILVVGLAMFSQSVSATEDESIQRGRYLTNLLGCGGCHTQGLLLGQPTSAWLAGSNVGMAYGQNVDSEFPAVVFASNLTPDEATGIGSWSKQQIVAAIRHGVDEHGGQLTSVMPWLNYSQLSTEDAGAIADYLKSLPAVEHRVPERVLSGEQSSHGYVRIGVYLFVPPGQAGLRE